MGGKCSSGSGVILRNCLSRSSQTEVNSPRKRFQSVRGTTLIAPAQDIPAGDFLIRERSRLAEGVENRRAV